MNYVAPITAKLPRGDYYVGDLCYVLSSRWDEVMDLAFDGSKLIEGRYTLKDGTVFVMFSTYYGDGEYADEEGNRFPVDSGTIGAVLVKDCDRGMFNLQSGCTFKYRRAFSCKSQAGFLTFGNVVINTVADADWMDDMTDDEWDDYLDELDRIEEADNE